MATNLIRTMLDDLDGREPDLDDVEDDEPSTSTRERKV